jgi:hypothetical protein
VPSMLCQTPCLLFWPVKLDPLFLSVGNLVFCYEGFLKRLLLLLLLLLFFFFLQLITFRIEYLHSKLKDPES